MFWVAADGVVGVCMNLGARLGRRGARGARRLKDYLMQHQIALARPYFGDVGGKGPFCEAPLEGVAWAAVFPSYLSLPAHNAKLVTVEEGAD